VLLEIHAPAAKAASRRAGQVGGHAAPATEAEADGMDAGRVVAELLARVPVG
jgi:hypothetical protein